MVLPWANCWLWSAWSSRALGVPATLGVPFLSGCRGDIVVRRGQLLVLSSDWQRSVVLRILLIASLRVRFLPTLKMMHQTRQVDQTDGARARHDRAVRGEPDARRRDFLWVCPSYGYDFRVADEFKVFTNIYNTVVDPKNFDPKSFVDIKADVCIIPPNSFALARTIEYFRIPRDVLTVCLGKSTYARCGIIVNVTPFEPEWEGHVTIEISNTTPLPAKIYANEGIAQVLFFQSDELCEVSYKDKKGKYQAQRGVTLPEDLTSHVVRRLRRLTLKVRRSKTYAGPSGLPGAVPPSR